MDEKEGTITEEEFLEFLSATTYEEQFRILLKHSEKNREALRRRAERESRGEEE